MKVPFGYILNPLDPYLVLPDPKKLDALHYAYRMRARYGTSFTDCALWLQSATGDFIGAPGFKFLYKRWISNIRKEKKLEVEARKRAFHKVAQNYVEKNFQHLSIETDDERDISAVAEAEAKEEWQRA